MTNGKSSELGSTLFQFLNIKIITCNPTFQSIYMTHQQQCNKLLFGTTSVNVIKLKKNKVTQI